MQLDVNKGETYKAILSIFKPFSHICMKCARNSIQCTSACITYPTSMESKILKHQILLGHCVEKNSLLPQISMLPHVVQMSTMKLLTKTSTFDMFCGDQIYSLWCALPLHGCFYIEDRQKIGKEAFHQSFFVLHICCEHYNANCLDHINSHAITRKKHFKLLLF